LNPWPLPLAVRAWVETDGKRKTHAPAREDKGASDPRVILVFDTETTVDELQQLNFGAWRVYARADFRDQFDGPFAWRDYQLVEEGLFYADDLRRRDPSGLAMLHAYGAEHRGYPHLKLLSRAEWIKEVFFPLGFTAQALLIGFNLPFDLSRIALRVAQSRKSKGAFSFVLAEYQSGQENAYRQRVLVKSIDSKRAFIQFAGARDVDPADFVEEDDGEQRSYLGRFLDLRTLTFALTDRSHSLASACQLFSVEHGKTVAEEHGVIMPSYIAYCLSDVLATWELYCRLREEYERHEIKLPPTRAYSPASIGKAYLDSMSITPPLLRQRDFPKAILGAAMVAYYGGRAECRIRRFAVPVVYLDFLSMYPTVNTLLRNWELLTSNRIEVMESLEKVRSFLDRVTLDDLFAPSTWRELSCLVLVEPDGDIHPTRARYGLTGEWQIGLNPLTSGDPMWYTLADVIASKLLSGMTPRIRQAVRFVPHGRQSKLKKIKLRGELGVDPKEDDFFQRVIELRQTAGKADEGLRTFLKVLANSASYGVFAEMNAQDRPNRAGTSVERYGLTHERVTVGDPEFPGRWTFPPLAASIAGAARLMLAMLERCVTGLGGTYAFCDTDSMAIVATHDGDTIQCPGGGEELPDDSEVIHALSFSQVEQIVDRFATLSPYDRSAIPGSILKIEDENYLEGEREPLYCYAISAKRYCLFNLDGAEEPILRKCSESGLGHLMNPRDHDYEPDVSDPDEAALSSKPTRLWIQAFWQRTLDEIHGFSVGWPDWIDRPALSRFTVSTPTLLSEFSEMNGQKTYAGTIKPFNFILVAHDASLGADRKVLIAPYERDAKKWTKLRWRSRADGQVYRITTREPAGGLTAVRVTTYRDVFERYSVHLEAKSLGPDGRACARDTQGLLRRMPVIADSIVHIGKETNRLDEVAAGLISSDGVYTVYEDLWALVCQVLRAMPIKDAIGVAERGRSATMELRAGRSKSSKAQRERIITNVVSYARQRLTEIDRDDLGLTDIEAIRSIVRAT
jgi:hypothetical protein